MTLPIVCDVRLITSVISACPLKLMPRENDVLCRESTNLFAVVTHIAKADREVRSGWQAATVPEFPFDHDAVDRSNQTLLRLAFQNPDNAVLAPAAGGLAGSIHRRAIVREIQCWRIALRRIGFREYPELFLSAARDSLALCCTKPVPELRKKPHWTSQRSPEVRSTNSPAVQLARVGVDISPSGLTCFSKRFVLTKIEIDVSQ